MYNLCFTVSACVHSGRFFVVNIVVRIALGAQLPIYILTSVVCKHIHITRGACAAAVVAADSADAADHNIVITYSCEHNNTIGVVTRHALISDRALELKQWRRMG